MTSISKSALALILWLAAAAAATPAQTESSAKPSAVAPPAPTVTVSLTVQGMRFAAPGSLGQLRLEVFDAAGATIYNSEFRPGTVIDWSPQDKAGQPLPDGAYQCVVTLRGAAGRLAVKQGTIAVQSGQASLQLSEGAAVGAVEPDGALAPMDGAATAAILTAHDGRDGQVVSTRGALTFRTGDFFSGQEREQMRLTEEGDLGLGTTQPRARLDVAGDIRATGLLRVRGVEFPDGSVQTSGLLAGRKGVGGVVTNATAGTITPAATGTGTQGRVAKWTDNVGTLGDSLITETPTGFVGINNPNPSARLSMLASSQAELRFDQGSGAQTPVISMISNPGDDTVGAAATLGAGTAGVGFVFTDNYPFFILKDTKHNVNINNLGNGTLLFSVHPSGNVGIGIGGTEPAARLEVAGSVKLTGAGTGITFGDGTTMTTAATGGGGGVSGSGATGALPLWSGTTALGNSVITQSGGNIEVAGSFNATGTITGGNVVAKYQDVAEWVPGRGHLPAGTVVSLDGTRRNGVVAAHRAYDTHVAGVVSAQPGVILGEGGADKVLVATTGRVKVRVDATRGAIKIGDLLVASNQSGVAMRSRPVRAGRALMHRPGTIIGKALEPLRAGTGEILVLLSLQ